MLKKVKTKDLKLGMYIHEVCTSWMDNPFWQKSFKLTKVKDLQAFAHYQIQEVWIDTSKGADVGAGVQTISEEEEKDQVNSALQQIATQSRQIEPRVLFQEELARARKILSKAKSAVVTLFQETRMGKAIELDAVADLVDEINQSIARNSDALLSLVRLKKANNYTYLHSISVCALMMALGREMELDEELIKELGIAGLLHDVGKIAIPGAILNKTGQLTEDEFAIMKTHPRKGWELLQSLHDINDITLDVCLHHHERMDGCGYPDRQSGDTLSLYAKMCAICDVYDAITSTRCYKASWEPAVSLRKMAEWKDGHFDQMVFNTFVKTVGIYPTGTLVKLKSGRLGIVIEQTEANLLKPVVKVFFSTNSMSHIMPQLVDLSLSPDTIVGRENPLQWNFDLEKISAM